MALLIALATLALVVVVLVVVGAPLRRARMADQTRPDDESGAAVQTAAAARGGREARGERLQRARVREALEAAREAKYREIRDAELDYRTGKLSDQDYRAIDSQLRAEAIEILNRLEAAEAKPRDA